MQPAIWFTSIFILLETGNINAESATWNQFRGPNGSGVANAFRPPLKIDPAESTWNTSIPNGHSSPIVWGDRIFVTGIQGKQFTTFALNVRDGSVEWQMNAPFYF